MFCVDMSPEWPNNECVISCLQHTAQLPGEISVNRGKGSSQNVSCIITCFMNGCYDLRIMNTVICIIFMICHVHNSIWFWGREWGRGTIWTCARLGRGKITAPPPFYPPLLAAALPTPLVILWVRYYSPGERLMDSILRSGPFENRTFSHISSRYLF